MSPTDITTASTGIVGHLAGPRPRVAVVIPSQRPPAWIGWALDDLSKLADLVSCHLRAPAAVVGTGLFDPLDRRFVSGPLAEASQTSTMIGTLSEETWPAAGTVDIIFCLGVEISDDDANESKLLAPPLGSWRVALPADLGRGASKAGATTETVSLQQIGGDRVLRNSAIRVHRLSPAITRQRLLWRAARLPARGLRDLLGGDHPNRDRPGGEQLQTSPLVTSTVSGSKAEDSARSRFGAVSLRAIRTGMRRALHKNGWYLGFQVDAPTSPEIQAADLQIIQPPSDRFWADPFPVVLSDEQAHVYVEEWPYALGRGRIAVLEITRDGNWRHLGTALKTDGHLSHPHVLSWKGERFLIPETSSRGTIEVYRQKGADPLAWELESVMIAGVRAVDATIQVLNDRWWMFVNLGDQHTSVHDELHIFHADSPMGPWSAHSANPVVSDPRQARPGGQLFEWNGRLCRPAQDCSDRYGRALTVFEIEELTTSQFRERAITHLEPEAFDANRLHTLNSDRWLRVIDLHRDRLRFR